MLKAISSSGGGGGTPANAPHNTNILDMTGGTGGVVIDIANQYLYPLGTTDVSVDWTHWTLLSSGNQRSVDWQNHILVYSGLTYLDWSNQQLLSSGQVTLDWGTQSLYNSGNQVCDWNAQHLYTNGSQLSIDWNSFILYDTSGSGSVAWANHQLINNGSATVDWQNRELINSGSSTTVDWNMLQLLDNASTIAVDWANRAIDDPTGQTLLSWGTPGKLVSLATLQMSGHPIYMNNAGGAGGGALEMDGGTINNAHLLNFDNSSSIVNGLGLLNFATGGLIGTYGQGSTVSNGVSAIYAQANLTAQAAAISATTLYAVPASGAGQYRLTFVAKITRAATTSSVLGGTNGFQVKYTDQDDSVVVTTPTGVTYNSNGTNLALNTTQAVYSGSVIINAKASTNIQYLMDYTSVGVTTMQYNLHLRLEKL